MPSEPFKCRSVLLAQHSRPPKAKRVACVHPRLHQRYSSSTLSWIRRTRVGGDSWLNEVPLGEETEEYDVLILDGASVVRTIRLASQGTLYTAAQQMADFGAPPASLAWRVAQISRAYGRGVTAETLSTL